MSPSLDEIVLADDPGAWAACGFELDGDTCTLGTVRIRLAGRDGSSPSPRGSTSVSTVGVVLRDYDGGDLDGLSVGVGGGAPAAAAPEHPNGVSGLDHLVAISPDLDRTVATLTAAGLDLRRVREEPTPAGAPRQAFFHLGAAILEVVQEPADVVERSGGPNRPAFFWGLALLAPDLDASLAFLGDRVGEARDAVQPGRRIATLRRAAGLAVPVALITPRPPR